MSDWIFSPEKTSTTLLTENTYLDKNIVISGIKNATISSAGLMSAADKQKLDSLDTIVEASTATSGLMSATDKKKLDALSTIMYSTADLTAGTSELTEGVLYCVYED